MMTEQQWQEWDLSLSCLSCIESNAMQISRAAERIAHALKIMPETVEPEAEIGARLKKADEYVHSALILIKLARQKYDRLPAQMEAAE